MSFFIVAVVVIFTLFIWNFHGRWFIADEWDFLAGRTAGNLDSLFRPHNQHWSTLPILYYRLLWNLVGIRSYLPYLISVLVCHLTIVVLLRIVMIRSSVTPWIATVVALSFALFGAGVNDIDYAFNIGFDGSVIFGLVALLLLDHAGPVRWRDGWGLVAGLAALMCSAVGVTLVLVIGVAVLLRHGLRRSVVTVLPLAVVYIAWYAAFGRTYQQPLSSPSEVVQFAAHGIAYTLTSIGHTPAVGIALAALLLLGLACLSRDVEWSELRRAYAAPLALLVGSVLFMLIVGLGRADGSLPSTVTYGASRYLYVVAALMLPAIALAASALAVRYVLLSPIILALLVAGIPGNIILLHDHNDLHTLDTYRTFFLSIPRLPIAASLPATFRPDMLDFDPIITMSWINAGVRSGKIPQPSPPPTPAQIADWTLMFAWHPVPKTTDASCANNSLPTVLHIQHGETITSDAPLVVTYLYRQHRTSTPIRLSFSGANSTVTSYWPMTARFTGTRPSQSLALCRSKPPAAHQ